PAAEDMTAGHGEGADRPVGGGDPRRVGISGAPRDLGQSDAGEAPDGGDVTAEVDTVGGGVEGEGVDRAGHGRVPGRHRSGRRDPGGVLAEGAADLAELPGDEPAAGPVGGGGMDGTVDAGKR